MEAGRELDRRVISDLYQATIYESVEDARAVSLKPHPFACWVKDAECYRLHLRFPTNVPNIHRDESFWFSPSRDIADAWRVVEKLNADEMRLSPYGGQRRVAFYWDELQHPTFAYGESAAHAICLAALKAVGHPMEHTEPATLATRINS